MKVLTDEKALELAELLLQNDKNIQDAIESKIPNVDHFVTESYVIHSIASAQLNGGGGSNNVDLPIPFSPIIPNLSPLSSFRDIVARDLSYPIDKFFIFNTSR